MNKKYVVLGIAALFIVIAGAVAYTQVVKPEIDNRTVYEAVSMKVNSQKSAISFAYPSGNEALAMIEPPFSTSTQPLLKQVYLLVDNKQLLDYTKEENPESAPASISIFVVGYESAPEVEGVADAGRVSKLQTWAQQNPQYSSWSNKTTEPEVVEIDGATAIKYHAKGTYEQDVYVALYQNDMYVFIGQYVDDNSQIKGSFEDLIQSVVFN